MIAFGQRTNIVVLVVTMLDSCECDTCVICLEAVKGSARVTTECGHLFHPRCIFNNIAKNTGNEEGTSRTMCPMCRDSLCDEVQPDTRFKMRLDDAIYQEGQAVLVYRDLGEVCESQREEKRALIQEHREEVRMLMDQLEYAVGEIHRVSGISELCHQKVLRMKHASFMSKLAPGYELRATVKLQNWFHTLKRAKLEKHRDAWRIYKEIIDSTFEAVNSNHLAVIDVPCRRQGVVGRCDDESCWGGKCDVARVLFGELPDPPLSMGEEVDDGFNVEDLD